MIKLVLVIFLCCAGLCLGQIQHACHGLNFVEFENFTRDGSENTAPNFYAGIGPGDPARAVYKRNDNKPFTLMSMSVTVYNARKVNLHAVGSDNRTDLVLTNVTNVNLPAAFEGFLMKKLVFNVRADDKTDVASLNLNSIEGCLPSEETGASSITTTSATT